MMHYYLFFNIIEYNCMGKARFMVILIEQSAKHNNEKRAGVNSATTQ